MDHYKRMRNKSFYQYCALIFCMLLSTWSVADNTKISVQTAYELSNTQDVLLIDLRSESEWLQTGVAPQAKLLSIHRDGGLDAFKQELTTLLKGDTTQAIALMCAGGVRSSRVQQYLQTNGFTQVMDVNEGMLGGVLAQGWIDQGLPVKPYNNQ